MLDLRKKTCIVSREKGGESTRINEITKVEDEEEAARIASLCRRCCARPQQMGACAGGEKKLRNQCVAHIVPKGGGGPLRCMMLEAKLSHLISLPKPGFSLGSKSFQYWCWTLKIIHIIQVGLPESTILFNASDVSLR